MPLAIPTFLISVAYVPWFASAAYAGRWSVMLVGGAVALIFVPRINATRAHWIGLLFLVWCAFSLVWSVSPFDSLGELIQWITIAIVFCIAAETENLLRVYKALGFGMIVSAVFSIAQALGYQSIWQLANGSTGLFLSQTGINEIAAIALIIAIGSRMWWAIPAPTICLLLASGREGWAMLAVAALFAAWQLTTPFGRVMLVNFGLWAIGFVIFFKFNSGIFHISDRIEIWSFALNHLRPFGWGLGTFAALQPGYEFAHNEFLHYAFELGIGVIPLIGVFVYALMASPVVERAALAALMAAALVYFPLHAPATAFLVAVLAGHLCGMRARVSVHGLTRRILDPRSFDDIWPIGIGALQLADTSRQYLSIGSKYPLGTSAVRSSI
jgi:hypothetical protein